MVAAFDDGYGGYESKFCLLLELLNVKSTAVAHGGTNLCQSDGNIVLQRACIRNIRIYTFLEGKLLSTAQIITLPVAGTVGAFTPNTPCRRYR